MSEPLSPYAELAHEVLIDVFRRGPERLRQALAGLDESELRERPALGKWSALEIALHVVDSERVGAVRIRQVFAQPGSTLPFYDQEIWAELLGYRAAAPRALDAALGLFAGLRSTTALLFERASEADWAKTGFHPERGPLTLRDLLENYADHGERHVSQILKIRARLDRPLPMPLLLSDFGAYP